MKQLYCKVLFSSSFLLFVDDFLIFLTYVVYLVHLLITRLFNNVAVSYYYSCEF